MNLYIRTHWIHTLPKRALLVAAIVIVAFILSGVTSSRIVVAAPPMALTPTESYEIWVAAPTSSLIRRYQFSTGQYIGSTFLCFQPSSIVVAPNGNYYVGCTDTSVIYVIDRYGAINLGRFTSNFPPTGNSAGLVVAPNGDVFAASSTTNTIVHYSASGALLGTITNSELAAPKRLVLDTDGSLYVGNYGDGIAGKVNRFNSATGAYLGTLVTGIDQLADIELRNGDLFILSSFGVKRYNKATGVFLGDFLQGGQQIYEPGGFDFGANGILYITSVLYNPSRQAIYRYNSDTGDAIGNGAFFYDTYSTGGDLKLVGVYPAIPSPTPTPTQTPTPTATFLPGVTDNQLWVPNGALSNVVKRFAASNKQEMAELSNCRSAFDMDFGPDGNIYALCYETYNIRRYSRAGQDLGVFASTGINYSTGLTFGADGLLYVTDYNMDTITRYDRFGLSLGAFVTDGINDPFRLAFGGDGYLYIASWNDGTGFITRHDPTTGTLVGTNPVVSDLRNLGDVEWRNGQLYVLAESGVTRHNPVTGALLGQFTTGGPVIDQPRGMEFGADGYLYIAEGGDPGAILRYGAQTGVFVDVFATGNRLGYVPGDPLFVSTTLITSTPTGTPRPARPDTIGVYKNGVFSLRNSNTSGGADLTAVFGGDASDLPIAGDWNGDGVDTIGVYRSATGVYFLSDSNSAPGVAYSLTFGNPGDAPIGGRWTTGMTHDGVGVYRNSNGILYEKIQLTTGFSDYFAIFGNPGDQGVAGDWNGDGTDSIGIYRPVNKTWFLTNNGQPSGVTFSDMSFTWDVGAGSVVVGDWDGDGSSAPGSFDAASTTFSLHPSNGSAGTDLQLTFGVTNGKPIAGKWSSSSGAPRVIAPVLGVGEFGNGGSGGAEN